MGEIVPIRKAHSIIAAKAKTHWVDHATAMLEMNIYDFFKRRFDVQSPMTLNQEAVDKGRQLRGYFPEVEDYVFHIGNQLINRYFDLGEKQIAPTLELLLPELRAVLDEVYRKSEYQCELVFPVDKGGDYAKHIETTTVKYRGIVDHLKKFFNMPPTGEI